MRQSETEFRSALDKARVWERKLAAWVRRRGWHVLPTYDFNGAGEDKAPALLSPPGMTDLVLPDLQCFRSGRVRWIECKWKARADEYRKGGYLVTGISLRLAGHYAQVRRATGADVWILFLHEREREVRGGPMASLPHSHDYTGGVMGRAGMRFWRYAEIPRLCDLTEIGSEATCQAS